MNKPKLEEQSTKLLEIRRAITGFYSKFAKSAGLTLAGLEILMIISKEKNCTQKTIVQKTFLTKQTVNSIISKFEKKQIIELFTEENTDKRNKIIKFTENGKIFSNQVIKKVKEIEYRALDAIGETKREDLINILNIYKNNLTLE